MEYFIKILSHKNNFVLRIIVILKNVHKKIDRKNGMQKQKGCIDSNTSMHPS